MNNELFDEKQDSTDCHSIKLLLCGYVDDELTQQQRQQVNLHMQNCEACSQNIEQLNAIKLSIKGQQTPSLEAEQIDALLHDLTSTWAQTIAWAAIIIGICVAMVFGVIGFYIESDVSTTEKIFSSLIWGGLLGLFLSVARQQIIARKSDKYKGVKL